MWTMSSDWPGTRVLAERVEWLLDDAAAEAERKGPACPPVPGVLLRHPDELVLRAPRRREGRALGDDGHGMDYEPVRDVWFLIALAKPRTPGDEGGVLRGPAARGRSLAYGTGAAVSYPHRIPPSTTITSPVTYSAPTK